MFFDLFISVLFEIFQYFPYLYAPINMQNIIQSGKLLKGFGYIYTLELCDGEASQWYMVNGKNTTALKIQTMHLL